MSIIGKRGAVPRAAVPSGIRALYTQRVHAQGGSGAGLIGCGDGGPGLGTRGVDAGKLLGIKGAEHGPHHAGPALKSQLELVVEAEGIIGIRQQGTFGRGQVRGGDQLLRS